MAKKEKTTKTKQKQKQKQKQSVVINITNPTKRIYRKKETPPPQPAPPVARISTLIVERPTRTNPTPTPTPVAPPVAPPIVQPVAPPIVPPANALLNNVIRPTRNLYAPADNTHFLTSLMEKKKDGLRTETPVYMTIQPTPAPIIPLVPTTPAPLTVSSQKVRQKPLGNRISEFVEKIEKPLFSGSNERIKSWNDDENAFNNEEYEQPRQMQFFQTSDEYKTNELVSPPQAVPVIDDIPVINEVLSPQPDPIMEAENVETLKTIENRENQNKLKDLYEQYNALYSEVDAGSRGIVKETQRSIRSQKKWKEKINELEELRGKSNEAKDEEDVVIIRKKIKKAETKQK